MSPLPLRALAAALFSAALLAFAPPAPALVPQTPDAPAYSVNGSVYAIARLGDTVYIGGSFTTVDGQPRTNLAAFSAVDGSLASWAPTANSIVYALVASGSTIYAGGAFNSVSDGTSSPTRDALAAFDTSGNVLGWNPDAGASAAVYGLVLDGPLLYVGGSFNTLGPGGQVADPNLGRVDATTGAAVAWTSAAVPAPNGAVMSLAASADGKTIYPGGAFTQIGGIARNGLAALNAVTGDVDPAWNPSDPSSGGSLDVVSVGPNGTVYAGGDFFPNTIVGPNSMGFAPRHYAAGMEPAGGGAIGNATSFAPEPDTDTYTIAAAPDAVYMGGIFSNVNCCTAAPAVPRSELAAVDPQTGAALAWDPSPDNDVRVIDIASDGSVYIGGDFTKLGTGASSGFASFSPPPANTAAPALQGTAQPGSTLTCTNGTWSGATPQTYSAQFTSDGAAVGPAGASQYTVQAADVGHAIGCTVTAHNRRADVTATATPVTIQAAPVATQSSATPAPGALPPPVFLRSANAFPAGGTVLVEAPGAAGFVPLTQPAQVVFGSIIDARNGTVRICTADARGAVDCANFFGGVFKLLQLRGNPPITELVLVGGNFKACRANAGAAAVAATAKGKSIRHLWGSGSGHFRTVGRFAAATVRGTTWLTDDRCNGTLIKVKAGAVTVRDLVRAKSLALKAPRQYFAKAGRRRA